MKISTIVGAITTAMRKGSRLLQDGKDIGNLAMELYNTIGKPADQITQEDLDRLAAASDEVHEDVQRPLDGE